MGVVIFAQLDSCYKPRDNDLTMQNKQFGVWAECEVARYLENVKGWRVLAKNVHFREGEIDLIMVAPEGLYFVEVKGRRSDSFGAVVESMTTGKLRRMRRAVVRWRARSGDFRPGLLMFAGLRLWPGGRVEVDLELLE